MQSFICHYMSLLLLLVPLMLILLMNKKILYWKKNTLQHCQLCNTVCAELFCCLLTHLSILWFKHWLKVQTMKSCSEYCCVINQHNQLKLYCSSALSVADSSLDQPNPTDRTIPVGQNVSHIQKDKRYKRFPCARIFALFAWRPKFSFINYYKYQHRYMSK